MGRTLFYYLFRDLMRIFVLAAVSLAAIMSLGGLLQPLTKLNLDAIQVGQMWLYLMPAMMTYSMPVAAVFATSVVYGRLTADNELTACRAVGISHRSVLVPAVAMGIVAGIVSLLFLSFVVPYFFNKAERVGYENAAKLVASDIERKHEFRIPGSEYSIFAKQAYVPSNQSSSEHTLVLEQPTIVHYGRVPEAQFLGTEPAGDVANHKATKGQPSLRIPDNFAVARQITLYLRQDPGRQIEVRGVVDGATVFDRNLEHGPQIGIEHLPFEFTMPSPLSTQSKFMNVMELRETIAAPEHTSRVQRAIRAFVQAEQQQAAVADVLDTLKNDPGRGLILNGGEPYQLSAPDGAYGLSSDGKRVVIKAGKEPVRLRISRADSLAPKVYEAQGAEISVEVDNEIGKIYYTIELRDVTISNDSAPVQKASETQIVSTDIPDAIKTIRDRKVADYVPGSGVPKDDGRRGLARETIVAINELVAELHSRASYSVSCLVLVLVGAVLGMQFKSGDFLTAFAVSFIPALVTITLVVSGGQTATDVSRETLRNPLAFGLVLIWGGNIISAILAGCLLYRISRT